ncbi:MAG: dihydroorotase [Desulfurococcales archaeon]|nr:dihydroorotase [Desulfurococcales archaeon]MCE4605285.1 dihydroorotase [Desulfurococcales archaeon]
MEPYWLCGKLVDYRGLLGEGCLRIAGGRIVELSKIPKPGEGVRDYIGKGVLVAPGFIDIHVHLRGLEQSYKETEETGGWAAARAGITLIVDMPNTVPRASTPDIVALKLADLSKAPVDHSLFAGIPESQDLEGVSRLPIAGYKIYPNDLLELRTSKVLREWRGLVVLHPELPESEMIIEEKVWSRGILRGCWMEAVSLEVVASVGPVSRIHVTHASCPATIVLAKKLGYSVDVAPHHLLYDYRDGDGCMYKVNPPIRGSGEKASLQQMLLNGVIDAVASDHAPHALWEKSDPLYCSPGIPWLEVWPWIIHRLVSARALSLGEFHRLVSRGPARILGLKDYGSLHPGARANLVVYNPNIRSRFEGPRHSMARHYPSIMQEVSGWPVEVIVGGVTVYYMDQPVHAKPGINPFTSRMLSRPA